MIEDVSGIPKIPSGMSSQPYLVQDGRLFAVSVSVGCFGYKERVHVFKEEKWFII